MALNLETSFASVVHTVPSRARLEGAFATVVHTAPSRARLEGAFASVVHTAPSWARLESAFVSVAHAVPSVQAIISNSPGSGAIGAPFTFIGSSSVGLYYAWSFISKPPGSTVEPTPFPDSGVATPIDMTSNEVLYHANETSGTTGTDTSGNANDATLTNVTVGAGGKLGTAWQNTSAIRVTPASSVAVGTDWTLSLWFYSAKPSGFATILFASSGNHHALINNGSNEIGVYSGAFRGSGAFITRGETVWRHLAVVGTGGNTLFYIDGALAGTTVGYQITANATAIAGDTFNQYFAERVDEIAIWSRALSSTEIADIYALQNVTLVTDAADLTFTPDLNGTYQVQLEVGGNGPSGYTTDTTTGTLVVGATASASSTNRILTGTAIDRNNIASGQLTLGVVRRKLRKKRN